MKLHRYKSRESNASLWYNSLQRQQYPANSLSKNAVPPQIPLIDLLGFVKLVDFPIAYAEI